MPDPNYETIKIEREADGITFVVFNRPEKRNAMSPQLHMEMQTVLEQLAVDPATKILVITGAGEAFSAGQDIKLYFRETNSDPAARRKYHCFPLLLHWQRHQMLRWHSAS